MIPDHPKLKAFNFIAILTLVCVVASTLVISDFFIYRSLTPFYLYLFSATTLLIITGCSLAMREIPVVITWPILIVTLFAFYVALHGFLLIGNFNPFHISLLFTCCLILSVFILTQLNLINLNSLFHAIVIIAVVESLICIGQYFKFLPGFNSYFQVTGTWENPNVSAMFLAMALPATFIVKANKKYIVPSIIILMVIAILLLQCRTAIIGVFISGIFFLRYRFTKTASALEKRNQHLKVLAAVLLVMILIPTAGYLYNAKKASADGRKLIWKLSADMVLKKPVFGYGYGSFEKNYNLFQSKYFKDGNGSAEELEQAGFVRMGYNELLENAVEGGLIGLLIIAGLFISLLSVSVFKKKKIDLAETKDHHLSFDADGRGKAYFISYTGIVVFVTMSFVNFSFQALPVICLFAIYAALISTHPSFIAFKPFAKSIKQNISFRLALSAGFICFGFYAVYFNTNAASESLLNQNAALLKSKGDYQSALQILSPLVKGLYNYEGYWTNYGNVLISVKDYANALDKFNKAKLFTANPEIYLKSALCYQKLGNYKQAEGDYIVAEYIAPERLTPKYDLMKMYVQLNDTTNAVSMAKQIVLITPKIKSNEATFYKYQAYTVLKSLGVSYNQPRFSINGSTNNPGLKYN